MLRRVALVGTDVSEELTPPSSWRHLVFLRNERQLLVRASVIPSSPILTLIKEALNI
jgi:hypothetical protein